MMMYSQQSAYRPVVSNSYQYNSNRGIVGNLIDMAVSGTFGNSNTLPPRKQKKKGAIRSLKQAVGDYIMQTPNEPPEIAEQHRQQRLFMQQQQQLQLQQQQQQQQRQQQQQGHRS
jgi:transcription initiation factor TFIID subunit TAF12